MISALPCSGPIRISPYISPCPYAQWWRLPALLHLCFEPRVCLELQQQMKALELAFPPLDQPWVQHVIM